MAKEILIWLGFFIIGSLIVSVILSPTAYDQIKDTFVQAKNSIIEFSTTSFGATEKDPLVESCLAEYEKYSRAGELKRDSTVTRKDYVKAESELEAEEFFDLYGERSGTVRLTHSDWNENYPVVLIISSLRSSFGNAPIFSLCKPDGKLTETSKQLLTF